MTEFEDFHTILYHSKIEFIGIKNGNQNAPWDSETQRNIDALSGNCCTKDLEAHLMAAKSYFKDIDYNTILGVARQSCKGQTGTFTFDFFNRLKLI